MYLRSIMLTIKHNQYIFPPRAQDAIPREDTTTYGELGWIAQLKYNDSRCIVKYCDNGEIQLWNRHAERFRTYFPPAELIEELHEIGERLKIEPGTVTMLDGGLLHQKHTAIKDTIVLWDILVHNDQHLIGTTYRNRYHQLAATATNEPWVYTHQTHDSIEFGHKFTTNTFIPLNIPHSNWDAAWEIIAVVNAPWTKGTPNSPNYEIKPVIEGLVLKDPLGTLEMGYKEKNNSDWLCRSRVHTGRHTF
jgi:hypothetical protein